MIRTLLLWLTNMVLICHYGLWVQKNVWFEKILVQKILGPKNFWSKKFLVQKNLWYKKFLVQNILVQNILVQKNFGSKQNFWSKKIFGQTKIFGKKSYSKVSDTFRLHSHWKKIHDRLVTDSKKFWSKKKLSVKKNLWSPKNFWSPKKFAKILIFLFTPS